MKLHQRLKEIREQQGLAAKLVAERAGLSPSFLTELEKGRAKPSLDSLVALASVYDIGIIDILSGVDWAGDVTNKALAPGLNDLFNDPNYSDEINDEWRVLLQKIDLGGIRPKTKRDWLKVYLSLRQIFDHLE
jgi:XRE family transcriptional regulator, regulator of sulfur utilization